MDNSIVHQLIWAASQVSQWEDLTRADKEMDILNYTRLQGGKEMDVWRNQDNTPNFFHERIMIDTGSYQQEEENGKCRLHDRGSTNKNQPN